jgi:tRNA A-37 threonylcarbamoyl transferase component Bud32
MDVAVPSFPEPELRGSLLGRYRIEAAVGQGGMARVFRGYDTQLKRAVAVKVLHPHLHARPEVRRRFDREAQAVARLHHPHIIEVYDFSGPDAEPSYLVTEFVPGQSLRTFAEAHAFDPPELAACCAVPLCGALEHAHAAGVVHRDIKPENVMVREDGEVKLTDFGIAALLDPDEKFTVTGSILGSPAHMAPETIDGKPADPRSDLFSLGTLLYWLATGKLPFVAPTPAGLLRQILEGTPIDPRQHRPSVSDGLARIITRLLQREPAARYQTAGDVLRDLLLLLADAGIDQPLRALASFIAARPPEAEAGELRGRLVAVQIRRGEGAQHAHRTSSALTAYGRALALDPENGAARARLVALRRGARKRRLLARGGLALLVCACAVGLLSLRHRDALRSQARSAPVAAAPAPQPGPTPSPQLPEPPAREPALAQTPATLLAPADTAAAPERPEFAARIQDASERTPSRPARAPAPAIVHAILAVHWVWGRVVLDGVDLGEGKVFTRDLTVGRHYVSVSHDCCADRTELLDVTPGKRRYTLEPGPPKPARLTISGAPPDAQVLIDDAVVGTVRTLPQRDLSTDPQPARMVRLTVGERSGQVKLYAGKTTPIDFLTLERGVP